MQHTKIFLISQIINIAVLFDSYCSDPEPLLDSSGASGGGPVLQLRGITLRRDHDSNQSSSKRIVWNNQSSDVGVMLKPSRAAAVEQWARQSSGNRQIPQVGGQGAGGGMPRRGSDISGEL